MHGIPSNRFVIDGVRTCGGDLELLRAESIGDVFSVAGGRVVTLSLEHRGAQLLGGWAPSPAAWTRKGGTLRHQPGAEPFEVPPFAVGVGIAPGGGRADTRTVAPSLTALAGLEAPKDATRAVGPYVAR